MYICYITCIEIITSDQPFTMACNRIGGVMVSMVISSTVDCGFEPRSGQTKDYKICICCFSANKGNNKITELRTILQRESQNS